MQIAGMYTPERHQKYEARVRKIWCDARALQLRGIERELKVLAQNELICNYEEELHARHDVLLYCQAIDQAYFASLDEPIHASLFLDEPIDAK